MTCVRMCVLSTGGGPGSPGIIPAGPDQRPGGHEQILCQDDEQSHLWVHQQQMVKSPCSFSVSKTWVSPNTKNIEQCGSTACCISTGKIQEVILQEHLEKEDEVLVSLAGLKQVSLSIHAECTSMICFCNYTLSLHVCLLCLSPRLLSDQRHP